MILPLLTLIPLALLALVTAALLAALDAAHHAVSRSALDKELAGRSARTREQVLIQHDEAPRTRGALELGRVLAEVRSEEHTSELQSRGHLVCRLLLDK